MTGFIPDKSKGADNLTFPKPVPDCLCPTPLFQALPLSEEPLGEKTSGSKEMPFPGVFLSFIQIQSPSKQYVIVILAQIKIQ